MILELGVVAVTPRALEALEEAGQTPDEFFMRHADGDWGELGAADIQANDVSIKEGFRIFSAYRLNTGIKIWIITEADRSVTTILLPEEY